MQTGLMQDCFDTMLYQKYNLMSAMNVKIAMCVD